MAVPKVRYDGPSKKNSWARWLVYRTMKKNNNNLCSFVGKTGSGKTWGAMSVCEKMSKLDGVPFSVDHVVFSLKELMDLINGGNLKRGSKLIFDEPQISIGSRDFQSLANKVFNSLVTTFRHQNYTLFFCTPFESLLDKSTRKLFHVRFETMSINQKKKTCRLKPRYIEYSDWKEKPYLKQMVVMYKTPTGEKRSEKMFHWDVGLPSQGLIDAYELKKTAFTTNLNKNISQHLEKFDATGKSMTAPYKPTEVVERKPLTDKQREVMELLAVHDFKTVAKRLNLSMGNIHGHKRYAMKKGYKIEEFKPNTPV